MTDPTTTSAVAEWMYAHPDWYSNHEVATATDQFLTDTDKALGALEADGKLESRDLAHNPNPIYWPTARIKQWRWRR